MSFSLRQCRASSPRFVLGFSKLLNKIQETPARSED